MSDRHWDILAERFRSGDGAIPADCLAACLGELWRRLRLRYRDALDDGELEDVIAEALGRAWARREQFDAGRGSPRAWLAAIAENLARDALRRRGRRLRVVSPAELDAGGWGPNPAAGPEPAAGTVDEEPGLRARVERVLDHLKPKFREILREDMMAMAEGDAVCPSDVLAALIAVKGSGVPKLRERARAAFRREWRRQGFETPDLADE